MLDVALKRRSVLERLAREAAWKRDLIDELGLSRSTVDRALDELATAGLAARTEAGFVATYSGALLLDVVTEARAVAETVDGTSDVLNHLPVEAAREPRFFDGATVSSVAGSSPAAVAGEMTEVSGRQTGSSGRRSPPTTSGSPRPSWSGPSTRGG